MFEQHTSRYYAPVAPLPLLKSLLEGGLMGSHVMLLAHDVLDHSKAYQDFFGIRGEWNVKPKIILDNSAAELDTPLVATLMTACQLVRADIVCLPDVIGDREETLAYFREWAEMSKDFMSKLNSPSPMAIPQGKDIDDIIACAHEMVEILEEPPSFWGIPRWVANNLGSRKPLIERMLQEFPYHKGAIHLLGMSKNLDDDIMCARLPGVCGIDSANPLVLGQQGLDILSQYEHLPRDKSKYWEEKDLNTWSLWNVVKLRALINA